MASTVWVKVLGFSEEERHSLNTLFKLSSHHETAYAPWSLDVGAPPHVALVDVGSYEADMDLASPSFNPHLKLICIGKSPPYKAWRSLARPLDWSALIQVLDELFANPVEVDIDIFQSGSPEKITPPGVKVSLLAGMTRPQRLYLRARLALAGFLDVDEAPCAVDAGERISQRHYDLVIVSLEMPDMAPWTLVQTLHEMPTPTRAVVVVTQAPSWGVIEQAERLGCIGLLDIPFNPRQVMDVLQKV